MSTDALEIEVVPAPPTEGKGLGRGAEIEQRLVFEPMPTAAHAS